MTSGQCLKRRLMKCSRHLLRKHHIISDRSLKQTERKYGAKIDRSLFLQQYGNAFLFTQVKDAVAAGARGSSKPSSSSSAARPLVGYKKCDAWVSQRLLGGAWQPATP